MIGFYLILQFYMKEQKIYMYIQDRDNRIKTFVVSFKVNEKVA